MTSASNCSYFIVILNLGLAFVPCSYFSLEFSNLFFVFLFFSFYNFLLFFTLFLRIILLHYITAAIILLQL